MWYVFNPRLVWWKLAPPSWSGCLVLTLVTPIARGCRHRFCGAWWIYVIVYETATHTRTSDVGSVITNSVWLYIVDSVVVPCARVVRAHCRGINAAAPTNDDGPQSIPVTNHDCPTKTDRSSSQLRKSNFCFTVHINKRYVLDCFYILFILPIFDIFFSTARRRSILCTRDQT